MLVHKESLGLRERTALGVVVGSLTLHSGALPQRP